ncbi:hypothetical protein VTH82DRAFT_5992 [Thermothelomyces myriococcoides]
MSGNFSFLKELDC